MARFAKINSVCFITTLDLIASLALYRSIVNPTVTAINFQAWTAFALFNEIRHVEDILALRTLCDTISSWWYWSRCPLLLHLLEIYLAFLDATILRVIATFHYHATFWACFRLLFANLQMEDHTTVVKFAAVFTMEYFKWASFTMSFKTLGPYLFKASHTATNTAKCVLLFIFLIFDHFD